MPKPLQQRALSREKQERTTVVPLNSKGKKIKTAMEKEYGSKAGKRIFYASENKGTIEGVTKGAAKAPKPKRQLGETR